MEAKRRKELKTEGLKQTLKRSITATRVHPIAEKLDWMQYNLTFYLLRFSPPAMFVPDSSCRTPRLGKVFQVLLFFLDIISSKSKLGAVYTWRASASWNTKRRRQQGEVNEWKLYWEPNWVALKYDCCLKVGCFVSTQSAQGPTYARDPLIAPLCTISDLEYLCFLVLTWSLEQRLSF